MAERKPVFNQINLVVRDMAAMVEFYERLGVEFTATVAGYAGQQPPWDGFMGARDAVVTDPDGNSVGLMGPIDPERSTMPPTPED